MTDNEIIKALECCCVVGECADCPCYSVKESDCKGIDWNDVYDLINRQKAEIEKLTINMNAFALGMMREIGREDSTRAEAIKEFADRVKEDLTGWETDPTDEEIKYTINNLVKQMVGENND